MGDFNINLLPARFAPETDELFSSWLVRLATAHIIKLHTFTKFIFPSKQIWNRDIDKSAANEHINTLSLYTGVSFQKISLTLLQSFEGILYETHNANGNLSWIMPVGVYRLTRNRFGLQMCPLCLSEDKNPYYRRLWRLSWATICLKHNITLLDRCLDCQNPIIFHRGDMGWRNQSVSLSMTQCSVCDLHWTSKKVIKSLKKPDSDVSIFQEKLENALADNWTEVSGFGKIHSINFFNGLKHIFRVLSVNRRSQKFREAVSQSSSIPLIQPEFYNEIHSFDHLPIQFRYQTIRQASWILADWYERFVNVAIATDSFSSVFLPYNETAPFWYWQPIHELLYRKIHPVTEEEIWSAMNFLEKRKSFILPKNLDEVLGRKFFDYKSEKFIISIYERMKKFNNQKEIERLNSVRNYAKELSKNSTEYSKTKAKHLSRKYNRQHASPPRLFRKDQKMFDYLITKYKRRERLKMVNRMEAEQNATTVAKEFGVSPGIIRKWYSRYKLGGISNLDDQSRSPRNFPHQTVFQNEEDWIRSLHNEGLGLSDIRRELMNRYNFNISEGGLYGVICRLKLILPCSKKNKFFKRNRKLFNLKRRTQF